MPFHAPKRRSTFSIGRAEEDDGEDGRAVEQRLQRVMLSTFDSRLPWTRDLPPAKKVRAAGDRADEPDNQRGSLGFLDRPPPGVYPHI